MTPINNGSIIELRGEGYYAELMINAVVLDHLKNPCGLDVVCIGPQRHPETGQAWAVDRKTGMPWLGSNPVKD